MAIHNKREALVLLAGDVLIFFVSLFLALTFRQGAFPSQELFLMHLSPFSFLFSASVAVFFIAGLYESHTLIFRNKLPVILVNAQIFNVLLAVVFFYFIPYFDITPKTILFIYLVVSLVLILVWRFYSSVLFSSKNKENALIIGSGEEMHELLEEVNNNSRYSIKFISSVDTNKLDSMDLQEEIIKRIYSEEVTFIAVDLKGDTISPLIPHLYNLIFSKVRFVDMNKLYEDIFNRVPLSQVQYNWFLENISASSRAVYDGIKRLMDIVISVSLLVVPLVCFPFVFIVIKLTGGGPVFIWQDRVGKNNQPIKILKYRTMLFDDRGESTERENRVTKFGGFLRKTRLDEFPQLWNVIRGDLSLIGPRPELPSLVKEYEIFVPHYNIRYLLKPGLSGWAQLYGEHSHHGTDVSKTKNKLSYDLYYIKNRSFILDLKISLRTLKVLFSREGV